MWGKKTEKRNEVINNLNNIREESDYYYIGFSKNYGGKYPSADPVLCYCFNGEIHQYVNLGLYEDGWFESYKLYVKKIEGDYVYSTQQEDDYEFKILLRFNNKKEADNVVKWILSFPAPIALDHIPDKNELTVVCPYNENIAYVDNWLCKKVDGLWHRLTFDNTLYHRLSRHIIKQKSLPFSFLMNHPELNRIYYIFKFKEDWIFISTTREANYNTIVGFYKAHNGYLVDFCDDDTKLNETFSLYKDIPFYKDILYIGELDLRMTFFNDKSYIDNLIYCIKHNAHFDQFHNDFIRPGIRKCNILIEKDKEHGIYAFGDDLYVLEKSSDNAYNNCKKCALLQECQRKYVNYVDGESTVIVQIKELYTEEVCHNGYRNFFKQLTKINNMEYNEKFKKVEGFDDVYFYEGNLYKREFIHTSLTSYLSCNSCDFVSTCHGNGLRMPVPEPCIKHIL